jgi:calmodulin
MACQEAETRKCLESAFKEVDTDGSGFIDSAEVEKVLLSVYAAPNYKGKKADHEQIKKEAAEMISSMDQNNDKKISLTEFIAFFEKMASDCAK